MFPVLSGSFFLLGGISMNKISYRPYLPQDFKPLSDIINITWGYEKTYTPATAVRLSNAYLRLCLAEQTFTQVAFDNGKPIGVIMGNHLHSSHRHLKFQIQARWDLLTLSLTAEGRRARDFFKEVDKIYEKLLSAQSQDYGGELSFLPYIRSIAVWELVKNCITAF